MENGYLRSWLYAPGNNPKLLKRVFEAGSDAVILDLEDAVPSSEKALARRLVSESVMPPGEEKLSTPTLYVRINHPDTGLAEDDVRAIVRPGLDGIRVPKVESPQDLQKVTDWLSEAESAAGMQLGTVVIVANIESALGVWNARAVAEASDRVKGLALGEVDYLRDIGAELDTDRTASLAAQAQLVVASRVAGRRPPVDSVFTDLRDAAGLEKTTIAARRLGFFGRAAIHPNQVETINRVFTPSEAGVSRAQAIIEAAELAGSAGSGAVLTASGEFVDEAVVRRARDLLGLARALLSKKGQ